ncbi:hypothetical protein FBZ86_11257 [Gluconacetobacter diazotrophicus]|nr:hypothetical protein FBZ86_11257 [Gluconacetobacter diazotrophicus]
MLSNDPASIPSPDSIYLPVLRVPIRICYRTDPDTLMFQLYAYIMEMVHRAFGQDRILIHQQNIFGTLPDPMGNADILCVGQPHIFRKFQKFMRAFSNDAANLGSVARMVVHDDDSSNLLMKSCHHIPKYRDVGIISHHNSAYFVIHKSTESPFGTTMKGGGIFPTHISQTQERTSITILAPIDTRR